MVMDALGISAIAFQGQVTNCGCKETVATIAAMPSYFLNFNSNRVLLNFLFNPRRGSVPDELSMV